MTFYFECHEILISCSFSNNRTYITLTWDECEVGTDDVNQIYVLGLGQTVPESLHGTEDGECGSTPP